MIKTEGSSRLDLPPVAFNGPTVAVVVIFMNAAKFLAEAIESVSNQTFTKWELVLVDDGSTDDSAEIALRYAALDPGRTKYVQHPGGANLGQSAARNLGIAETQAPLIAFLDADDVWVPNKLAEQVSILADHPQADIVFGSTKYWYSWTGDPKDIERDYVHHPRERGNVLIRPPFLVEAQLLNPSAWLFGSMSNIMLRRDRVMRLVGGFDESFRTMGEDTVFLVKVFLRCHGYYADSCWDWYRQHPDSFTARKNQKSDNSEENFNFLSWTEAYFAKQGVRDPYLNAALLSGLEDQHWLESHPVRARVRYLQRKMRQRAMQWLRTKIAIPSGREVRQAAGQPWLFLVRWLRLRSLWRIAPVRRESRSSYGIPVDRYYVEAFLEAHQDDIHGCVLEIGDARYTSRFGGDRIRQSEVLHAIPGDPAATLVADITNAAQIPSDHFDCIIFTQALHCIYDFRSALATLHRILKANGVLLATVPGVAHHVPRSERAYRDDFWRWTTMSAERMFNEFFPREHVSLIARGNVLTSVACLHGLVIDELRPSDLAYDDPDYELCIGIRAVKPSD